jgi:hypothetical protein
MGGRHYTVTKVRKPKQPAAVEVTLSQVYAEVVALKKAVADLHHVVLVSLNPSVPPVEPPSGS